MHQKLLTANLNFNCLKSLSLLLGSFLVKYYQLCWSVISDTSYNPFSLQVWVCQYKSCTWPWEIVFHCLLQKCSVSRAAEDWLLRLLLLPPLTIPILAQEELFCMVKRTLSTLSNKEVLKTFMFRKIPLVNQQKGIPQQFTNWILRSY